MAIFRSSLSASVKRGGRIVKSVTSVQVNLVNGMAVTTSTQSFLATGEVFQDVTFGQNGQGGIPTLGQLTRITPPELHDTLASIWPRWAASMRQMVSEIKSKGLI